MKVRILQGLVGNLIQFFLWFIIKRKNRNSVLCFSDFVTKKILFRGFMVFKKIENFDQNKFNKKVFILKLVVKILLIIFSAILIYSLVSNYGTVL